MQYKWNKVQEKMAKKELVVGTLNFMGGSTITEIYGATGYDVVWICTEHGNIDKTELLGAIVGASSSDIATLVRVAWNDPVLVKSVLELGVDGIIFPMVNTAEEARKAVAACRYPPYGVRGFGPVRAIDYGRINAKEYVEKISQETVVAVQCEHIDSLKNLDEILEVEGVGLLIIGPMDFSASMGHLPNPDHPECKAAFDEIAKKCKAHGKPFAPCIGYSEPQIQEWIERGCEMIFVNHDMGHLYSSCTQVMSGIKSINKKVNG
ncbi:MAG: HpcH/HpaI aldolase/citrate lyase family protein [Oscillospiraceae bacterium]